MTKKLVVLPHGDAGVTYPTFFHRSKGQLVDKMYYEAQHNSIWAEYMSEMVTLLGFISRPPPPKLVGEKIWGGGGPQKHPDFFDGENSAPPPKTPPILGGGRKSLIFTYFRCISG